MVFVFHPDDLVAVDVRGYILRERARFFRGDDYDANEMASQIALEALMLGAGRIDIIRDSEWITISSDIDWLAGLNGDAFSGLVPIPQVGRNAVTAEILAVVFASGVATATRAGAVLVKGNSLGPIARRETERGRAVAFRIARE